MNKISLCMIVKNEEKVLERCLESVKDLVDEINIVDTGSTDRTKEIASKYTDRIFDFEWTDHFSEARNYSYQQATQDYVLWLDADDVLSPKNQEKFLQLKMHMDPSINAVSMDYHLTFDQHGNVIYHLRRYRLSKRSSNFQWEGAVHEFLAVHGDGILDSNIAVHHLPIDTDISRNIKIYESLLSQGKELSSRDLYYYANELKDNGKYRDAIHYYSKFLETKQGWLEDNVQACYKIGECNELLGEKEQVFNWALTSFRYALPRPQGCYMIGVYFVELEKYDMAIYWLKQAIEVEDSNWFVNDAYKTWMPHLQLCVCYDRLGDYVEALRQNELAAKYRPDHPSVLHNQEYLENRLCPA